FLTRRILTALGVVLAATYIFYLLAANAGDPLEDLRTSNQRNRDELIAARTAELRLDVPPPIRYFHWAGGAAKCLVGRCDLGRDWRTRQEVTSMLSGALGQTLRLVAIALVLAIVIGVSIGIISALRQYSGFDYGITFASFLVFSLPSFWVGVLLKQWGAIGFNDFLENPHFPLLALFLVGAAIGVVIGSAAGGRWKRRLTTGGIGGLGTAILLTVLDRTDWFVDPSLGPVVIGGLGGGIAVLITFLSTGLSNKRALYSSLVTVALAVIAWFPLQTAFRYSKGVTILGILVGFIVLGAFVGWLFRGPDRWISVRASALTGTFVFGLMFVDYLMGWWKPYNDSGVIDGRPIATVGSVTPELAGSGYWVGTLDTYTHMVLPVTTLVLVSLAGYTRYARASLLEVMHLDYVRTARAKGLPERAVIMRHAFRNALIPLATIIPLDLAGLVGGAVITETVFGWNGMGRLFVDSLAHVSLNPLMGYFLVTSVLLLLGNIVADVLYATLDPRIRLNA
ncbi:MAG: ABC transporter permease, partial [Actinobacteria bacterium]|nr:ABC transporter permease [Actinomycetota bacterium]